MASRTISAYADEETARAIEHIALVEDRSPAQIAAAALRFYTRLPPEAHAAYRLVERVGTPQDMDAMTREIARQALHAEWEIALRNVVAAMPPNDALVTEDDIIAEAVRLTR